MSSELASRLGAPVVGSYQVRGLGGYTTQVVRAGPLRIGNAAYPDAYYAVLSDLRRYGYDVVLGADVLGAPAMSRSTAPRTPHSVRRARCERSRISVPLTFRELRPDRQRRARRDARLSLQ